MTQVRRIAMFGSTFAVALGIGFVMQNGDALASRFATDDELRAAQEQVKNRSSLNEFIVLDALPRATDPAATVQQATTEAGPDTGPVLPDLAMPTIAASIVNLPVFDRLPELKLPVHFAAADPDVASPDGVVSDAEPVDALAAALDCTPSMTATVGTAATVILDVAAPCAIDTRGTLHHQGMMFTFVTDGTGSARLTAPALAETAVFIAELADGASLLSTVEVPELAAYDRAVLQWQGETGMQLHAREFGAVYGSEGHVWQAAARDLDGDAGFLMRLGADDVDQALMAEVYTFPRGTVARDGSVALTAELEITASNCGREVAAQSMQIGPDGPTEALDLVLTLPDCDATGDFLVLQNMFSDLTLAAAN